MNISELVAELEVRWAELGDVEVTFLNQCCCYGDRELDPRVTVQEFQGTISVLITE